MHEVLVNRLGGLSQPRKNVVRLTDRPDMTLDVYRGRTTTKQQQQHHPAAIYNKPYLPGRRVNSLGHKIIVYAHGRRLCSNRFRHGSTTISYPQFSLTFLRECYLHRCRGQSFAIRAYAMSAIGIDVVSSHTEYCRIAYGITR